MRQPLKESGSTKEHQQLIAQILLEASKWDCRVWANNTGIGRSLDGSRIIKFGRVGSADILGIHPSGLFLAIEVKTGNAIQSKQQKLFQKMIQERGGIYILARSVGDVTCILSVLNLENLDTKSLGSTQMATTSEHARDSLRYAITPFASHGLPLSGETKNELETISFPAKLQPSTLTKARRSRKQEKSSEDVKTSS